MIVKAIYKNEKQDYFRDKVTGEKRIFGDIFECDDEIAKERIKKGFVVKATKKEENAYKDGWAVTNENDGKVHVRPVKDGEILDTPVEKVITPDQLDSDEEKEEAEKE